MNFNSHLNFILKKLELKILPNTQRKSTTRSFLLGFKHLPM